MKRVVHRASVAAVCALTTGSVLTACAGGGTSSATGASREATVIIGTSVTPATLDPLLSDQVQTDFTVRAMYEKLVDFDASGAVVPELATGWSYNPDGTVLTLELRDDVTFHSGNALTAADVVYTLDRAKSVGIGSASFISDYVSSKATSDHTVEITLAAPNSSFVGALSKIYVVDSGLVQANAGTDQGQAWLAAHDAGSGPFKLAAYTPNQSASYVRTADSWRFEESRPEAIEIRYIPESGTRRDSIQAGNLDIVTSMSVTDNATFESKPGFEVNKLDSAMQLFLVMNTAGGATANPDVREALQYVYDYDGHVSSILSGQGHVATGLVSPIVDCRLEIPAAKQDLDKARVLFEKAGMTGKTLTLAYQSGIPEHNKAATMLQSNLAQVGVNLELQTVTYPQYVGMITAPETTPDLALLWDFPYYPAIGPMLYRVYDSQFVGETNYARYQNPAVDALLESGMRATDSAAACADFVHAQELIVADRATANISNPLTTIVERDGIEGIEYKPTYQLFDTTSVVLSR